MPAGRVVWFHKHKGYGFIRPDGGGPDVFVHISEVNSAGLETLNPDQSVSYEVGSIDGKRVAQKLQVPR